MTKASRPFKLWDDVEARTQGEPAPFRGRLLSGGGTDDIDGGRQGRSLRHTSMRSPRPQTIGRRRSSW
jgi:hypothetical protein